LPPGKERLPMFPKFLRSEILPYASVEIVRCSADHHDVYDIQPNATCQDCGQDFSRAEDDPGPYCDACSDRRDAHTTMLEHRLVMAKALVGKSALAAAPKLTSGEMSLAVALLGLGWSLERVIDDIQKHRRSLPFGQEVA
jgi:hypothetical protein